MKWRGIIEMSINCTRLVQLITISLILSVLSPNVTPVVYANTANTDVAQVSPSADPGTLLVEYSISGSALNIVSSAPNTVWFTMPAANKIGTISVNATGNATTMEYAAPTPNSEPYDLVYDSTNNAIWFTQKSANQIGRLDIAAGTISEFSAIPTANSMPTGIDIAPDGSIWFAESGTNKLGKYVPSTNTFSESATYTPTSAGVTNANLHDLAIFSNGSSIWVTAPDDHRALLYSISTNTFSGLALSGPLDPIPSNTRQPYNITLAPGNIPWITDIANNQIGQVFQGTLANVAWYALPTDASSPTGIAYGATGGNGIIFFTGNSTDIVGTKANSGNGALVTSGYSLPSSSQPSGITVDSAGGVWIAQSGSNKIALWKAPYYGFTYLPLIEKIQ